MNKKISLILFFIFVFSLWYVGVTFYHYKDIESKKISLVHEIHNVIGTDTLYECESVQYRSSSYRFFNSKEFIEKYGYSYDLKYEGYIDGVHKYNFNNWPWLIDKTILTDEGEYISYRIVPVSLHSKIRLKKINIDSLLIQSYNEYILNFCPSNINENDHSSFQFFNDMRSVIKSNLTFDLESPKNNIPEVNQTQILIDNNVIILEITKNESFLTPRQYIVKSQSKIRKIGCFVVILLLLIIIISVKDKFVFLYKSKMSNLLAFFFLAITIILWGWYYHSVVIVNEIRESEAQERLNRMFDEDVYKIYPMIKEAAEKSTLFKSLELEVVESVYPTYGFKYEIEEKLNDFYKHNIDLINERINAQRLNSMVVTSCFHTSKRTDEERLRIRNDIQNVSSTIHRLLRIDPDDIEDREDREKYIRECDSLNRQVFFLLGTLEKDMQTINK